MLDALGFSFKGSVYFAKNLLEVAFPTTGKQSRSFVFSV